MMLASGSVPASFPPAFRHLWLMFLAVGILNIAVLRRRLRKLSSQQPDLARGYNQYMRGLSVALTLPWLIVGWGIEVGHVPSVFSFLTLTDRNPYVIAFYVTITSLLVIGFYWVVWAGGAEFLAAQRATLGQRLPATARGMRLAYVALLALWTVMLVLRWMNLLPVPPTSSDGGRHVQPPSPATVHP